MRSKAALHHAATRGVHVPHRPRCAAPPPAGLSLRTQELTAAFLLVRLFCSFMMEYDIHTLLDAMTLVGTGGCQRGPAGGRARRVQGGGWRLGRPVYSSVTGLFRSL